MNTVTSRLAVLPAIVAAASLLFLAGCGSGSSSSATPTAQASTTAVSSPGSGSPSPTSTGGSNPSCVPASSGLISALTFDKDTGVYATGTPIAMTLVLTNCAATDEKLVYPTTQRSVFFVTDSGGNDMWRSTDGKEFGQSEGTETIASEQSVQYTETWDQKDRNGSQVPDGQYKVSAFSVGCIETARTGCQFGPVRTIRVGSATPSPAATTALPTASP